MGKTQTLAIALTKMLTIIPAFGIIAASTPAFSSDAPSFNISPSEVLGEIAQNSGLSSPRITVCNVSGKCLNYRGDRPPQSAASLIKVPIAIALLHKLSTENISLDTPIYVDPDNYTEENYADIKVGTSYPLRYLLTQMIANSSNIASNQIIDYLGWEYIDRTLDELGYRNTRVSHKLTGRRYKPSQNRGWALNQITSNELTNMMVQIYDRKHPEYDVLTDIFRQQANRLVGFRALQTSATGRWLGEKTGENSQVRGTTVAVEVNNKVYIITVTEDAAKSERRIRRCLIQIVDYLASNEVL